MGNTSTCFFLFILLKSFSIYIHRGAMVNCEKIISQLGKNIFPVGQILFPVMWRFLDNYCMNIQYKYAFVFSVSLPYALYDRQADTVYLLIDVEGVNVGHSADIVDDSHDSLLYILVVDVVLTAYPSQQLLRVETFGRDCCIDKPLHKCSHNLVT